MSEFKHISVEEVKNLLEHKEITVADIRDLQSFMAGHIPTAQSVNDSTIDHFLKETDKDKPLVCCCYHGISSQNAAAFFIQHGFKEVYSMDGGYEGWRCYHEQV